MSVLECMIVDLVQIAESPLFSTYRWLGRQIRRDLPLSEFLRVVNQAIERDVLRLWSVDPQSGDRTELFGVPLDLEARYAREDLLGDSYDPFGMSLTLGPKADAGSEPRWKVSLAFDERVFELQVRASQEAEAMEELARCYPDLRASITTREERGDLCRIVGTLTEAPCA